MCIFVSVRYHQIALPIAQPVCTSISNMWEPSLPQVPASTWLLSDLIIWELMDTANESHCFNFHDSLFMKLNIICAGPFGFPPLCLFLLSVHSFLIYSHYWFIETCIHVILMYIYLNICLFFMRCIHIYVTNPLPIIHIENFASHLLIAL